MPSDEPVMHFDLAEFRRELDALLDQAETGLIAEQAVMREVTRLWNNLATSRAEFLSAFGHLVDPQRIQQAPPPPGTMPRVVAPNGQAGPNPYVPPYANGRYPQ